MNRRLRRGLVALALSASALGQSEPARSTETIVVGQTFLTASLDPAEGNAGWALTSHGVTENLFTVDRDGHVTPRLAERLKRQEDGTWLLTLKAGSRFSDGAPVTAEAVAAALRRTQEKNPVARASAGRFTLEATDERSLRIATERPTPVLASVLAEWPYAIYRVAADGAITTTGPYQAAAGGFTPGGSLKLIPNSHYDQRASVRPSLVLRKFADGQALALAARSGEVDLAFNLPSESLAMLRADRNLTAKSFPVGYQYMLWQNARRGALQDERVRRAVAATLDRAQMAAALRSGKPSAGAFAAPSPFARDAAPLPDAARAERLLDEAGWRRGANGLRRKDGAVLKLTLWAYPQRPDLVTLQPVIRAQLRALGLEIETRLTEAAGELAKSGEFDLLLWAQHTAPAGDPAFFLNLFLRTGAVNNYAGWSDAAFDAVLDQFGSAAALERRIELSREAEAILHKAAPVVFLLTPEWHVALSQRVSAYEPWGSDYFVIRPDLAVAARRVEDP